MSFIKHLPPAWRRNSTQRQNVNAAILSALDTELKDAEQEAIKSKIMLRLETSQGEWLDQFGDIFSVYRELNESDDTYRDRIVEFVRLERGTIPAIIAAIRAFFQDYDSHIEIYEPHNDIFTLNRSKLNGKDHFMGKYYTFAVIDIIIGRVFPSQAVIDVVNAFKPAGVTVHLTYKPSSHNPNAVVPDLPMASSKPENTYRKAIMVNGMHDRIRGHLNMTNQVRNGQVGDNLFMLNQSKLNSDDRLTGSFTTNRPNFNLASYSTNSLNFTNSTSMAEVSRETTEMEADFYTRTGETGDTYAQYLMDKSGYLYMTLDVKTYLETNYSRQLNKLEPSGIFTKATLLAAMETVSLQYSLKATTAPNRPLPFRIQVYNLSTNSWVTLHSGDARFAIQTRILDIANISPYLSNIGIVFTRIQFPTGVPEAFLHLHYYELSFKKLIGEELQLDVAMLKDVSRVHREIHYKQSEEVPQSQRPTPMSDESLSYYWEMSSKELDEDSMDRIDITANRKKD